MNFRALKYSSSFLLVIIAFISIWIGGSYSFLMVALSFGFLPLLELLLPPDHKNISSAEKEMVKKDFVYDLLVYLIVPMQYLLLGIFLWKMQDINQSWTSIIGRTSAMGICCGVFGINVAHELGHRRSKFEIFLAKSLLLTSLYMHFIIEHNRGHHLKVSTPADPASARKGEMVYAFWLRSIVMSYLSAWKLESQRLKKRKTTIVSLNNEMIQGSVIQISFVALIFFFAGMQSGFAFLFAAFIGILLLETVNYIEHYGLQRKHNQYNKFDIVQPAHSWNSDHVIGRIMLFELSRHSDHHYRPGKKYQLLRHLDNSPQMPAGYPGMMVLSLFPPIWFWVMHKQIDTFKKENSAGILLA